MDELQYLDGRRCPGQGAELPVRNPGTGELIACGTAATADDVARVVASAERAFAEWSRTTPSARAELLAEAARQLNASSS